MESRTPWPRSLGPLQVGEKVLSLLLSISTSLSLSLSYVYSLSLFLFSGRKGSRLTLRACGNNTRKGNQPPGYFYDYLYTVQVYCIDCNIQEEGRRRRLITLTSWDFSTPPDFFFSPVLFFLESFFYFFFLFFFLSPLYFINNQPLTIQRLFSPLHAWFGFICPFCQDVGSLFTHRVTLCICTTYNVWER